MGKSKVGIITFHFVENYGGVLQAFALQSFLENRGDNDVRVIDYRPKYLSRKYDYFDDYFCEVFKEQNFVLLCKLFIYNLISLPFTIKRKRNFKIFIEKYLLLGSKQFRDSSNFYENVKNYDVLICGSDQIWNPDLTEGLDPVYFAYDDNIKCKRISYAASLGKLNFEEKYEEEFQKYLHGFSKITVRESTAKDVLCFFRNDIITVCDPVFLLNKYQWKNKLQLQEHRKESKYILVYKLQDNDLIENTVSRLVQQYGLRVIEITLNKKLRKNSYIEKSGISPTQFVDYILNAEYVVTNSFHATAFSIIFHKKMYVIHHQTRGSRTQELLRKYSLQMCEVEADGKINDLNKIDWSFVETKIKEERENVERMFDDIINE